MDAKRARKVIAAIKKEIKAAPKELFVVDKENSGCWDDQMDPVIALKPFFRGGKPITIGSNIRFDKLLPGVRLSIPPEWLFNDTALKWNQICGALDTALAATPLTVSLGNEKDLLEDLTRRGDEFFYPDNLEFLLVRLRCQYKRAIDVLLVEYPVFELFSPTACQRMKKSVTWPKKSRQRDQRQGIRESPVTSLVYAF